MQARREYRVGSDIGGTFTDLVTVREDGRLQVEKVLSTPDDLISGILAGYDGVLANAGIPASAVTAFAHATTVVTNAVIEGRGAKVGLLTTHGFRDAIEIGRELRYDVYDLNMRKPAPLAPRSLRLGVRGRILADGTEREPLNLADIEAAAATFREAGVEAVAIVLLHSYLVTAHEEQAKAVLSERLPGVPVSTSSELVREVREYERTSTTLVNAYVQPIVKSYVGRLAEQITDRGTTCPLYCMVSSGGMTSAEGAMAAPVRMIESGPAAGAMAAAYFGRLTGHRNLISLDVGGTTAKIAVIDDGEPEVAHEFETARVHRLKKGSGHILKIPVVEMIEIGAGGGSIARIDRLGLLQVGPESAGAQPGPACYGLGGTEPTVTDSDLVLGRLDPDSFLGGDMALDVEAARKALEVRIGEPYGWSVERAALALSEVIDDNMANATRLHLAERGRDPRGYSLFAFGGAGPVHAYGLARLLGIKEVIYPFGAGALSALGLLVAPLLVEEVESYVVRLSGLDWDRLRGLFGGMERRARAALAELGVADEDVEIRRSAELRFVGQGHEVLTRLPDDAIANGDAAAINDAFKAAYSRLFGRVPGAADAEGLLWRLTATGPAPTFDLAPPESRRTRAEGDPAPRHSRQVVFPETGGPVDVPVYSRYDLEAGWKRKGPVVVEERESTVVLGPDAELEPDELGNLIARLG
jgi:N-methylhydantoinase A